MDGGDAAWPYGFKPTNGTLCGVWPLYNDLIVEALGAMSRANSRCGLLVDPLPSTSWPIRAIAGPPLGRGSTGFQRPWRYRSEKTPFHAMNDGREDHLDHALGGRAGLRVDVDLENVVPP